VKKEIVVENEVWMKWLLEGKLKEKDMKKVAEVSRF